MYNNEKREDYILVDEVDAMAKIKARKILDEVFAERLPMLRGSAEFYEIYKRINQM